MHATAQVSALAKWASLVAILWGGMVAEANGRDLKSLALSEAQGLCVQNHGRPEKVLALADASGWKPLAGDPPPDGRPSLLDLFGVTASPDVRLKSVGQDQLILHVAQRIHSTRLGRVTTFICSVGDEGPGSSDLIAAMARQFQVPPTQSNRHVALWVYVDTPQGRRFLPASRTQQAKYMNSGRTLISMAGAVGQSEPAVFYSETELARPLGN